MESLINDITETPCQCQFDRGYNNYLKGNFVGSSEMCFFLNGDFSEKDFSHAWNQERVRFVGPMFDFDDEGWIIVDEKKVGKYIVVDVTYKLVPLTEPDETDLIELEPVAYQPLPDMLDDCPW